MNEKQLVNLVNESKADGYSLLHMACLNNNHDIVKLLIETTAPTLNLNITNLNKQTPLHLAVERKYFKIIRLLIETNTTSSSDHNNNNENNSHNKCDLNAQDVNGDAPLHYLLKGFYLSRLKNLFIDSQNSVRLLHSL